MKHTFLLVALPCGLFAQSDSETRDLIRSLLARVEQLEKRVAELEGGRASPAPPVAAAPSQASGAGAAPMPEIQPVYPSLKLTGFSDINFASTDLRAAPSGFGAQTLLMRRSGFAEGQLALHLRSALSPKVSFFSEITFGARSDAAMGVPPAPGFNAEVERAIIRFEQNDYFKVSFGRYHTPINYWNTAFHHGQWLQTTIGRPEMTQFGGIFIPVHFVGSLIEGGLPAGGLNLNYNVGLGNGRGAVLSRGGDFGDVNNNKAWLVSLFARPDRPYGLQVGGAVYRDRIELPDGPPNREWIQSAHVVWQKEAPEFIAEFANVSHRPVRGGVTSNSQAFYVQAAYRLPWFERIWKPYARFEYVHVPRSDRVFRAFPSFSAPTLGIRYDISNFAAIKLEYRHYRRPNLPGINGAFLQTAFTF